jgi:hypothetical protein
MAANAVTHPTLLDLAKQVKPGWETAIPVLNLLDKRHGLYTNLPFSEANGAISHRASITTSLPTTAWRMFGYGTAPTHGSHANVTFGVGFAENIVEVDEALIRIAPDRTAFVTQKVAEHAESALQEWSSTAFYGTAAAPNEFVGFASLYSDPTATNGRNVLDAGGTDGSDNASIWLFNAGPTVGGIYPRGIPGGIERFGGGYTWAENFGTTGLRARVWREGLRIGGGIKAEDWRDVVRIGSIDVSAMVAQTNDADLIYLTRRAKHRMANRPMYRRFWCMHPTVWEFIEHQRDDRQIAGGGVSKATIDGVEMDTLHGYPVVLDDNLLLTEAAV